MTASLIIESAKNQPDCHVTQDEVFERVRQLQASSSPSHTVPQFYFGPCKVEQGSVVWHLRRVTKRKQAEGHLAELNSLKTALTCYRNEHEAEQGWISYPVFREVSVLSFKI